MKRHFLIMEGRWMKKKLVVSLLLSFVLLIPSVFAFGEEQGSYERSFVARVIFAEAGPSCNDYERQLIASVIANRIECDGFGNGKLESMYQVVNDPNQFSCIGDSNNENWAKSGDSDKLNADEKNVWDQCYSLAGGNFQKQCGPSGRPLVYYHDKSICKSITWDNTYFSAIKELETDHFIFYSKVETSTMTAAEQTNSKEIRIIEKSLAQLNQNRNKIGISDVTTSRTVTFKAELCCPEGEKAKLQVELRRLDEYGSSFVRSDQSNTYLEQEYKNSDPVTRESNAEVYAKDLISGNYHWRARAVGVGGTIDGMTGDWVDFGGNDISETDFTVSASTSAQNDQLKSEYSDLEQKSIENVRKVIDSYLVLASSYGSSSISYDVIGAKSFGKKTDAASYMNDMGITYGGTQEALAIIDTYGLEDTEFCVVIVKYNFVLFGQDISLLTTAICDEKGEAIGYKAFQDLMQGYGRSR
jgi:hypothetical protein